MAQYNNPRGRVSQFQVGLSVGGKIGTTMYFGDLVDDGRVGWTLGFFGEKLVKHWFSVRLEVESGKCKGAQLNGNGEHQLEFHTGFGTLGAIGKVSILDALGGYDDARPWQPYAGIGGGIALFKCTKTPTNNLVNSADRLLEKFGEDYPYADWATYNGKLEFAPEVMGLVGVRYAYSSKLYFFLDIRGDLLFSDTFDGHDGYPYGPDGLSWESGKPFDCIWFAQVGAQYRFHNFNFFSNTSSKYSRKNYLRNKSSYDNSKRVRRR